MEAMVPLLRVLKEGRILKNIFLNEPPAEEDVSPKKTEGEEKILLGRHPDCQIVLEHPSISRFHLQICVQASSRRISVVDLSSVHGTWISGKMLQPQIPVDLSDGDTIRIGASSRIYELHWIPLTAAFNLENSQVDQSITDAEYPAQKFKFSESEISPSKKLEEKEVVSPSSPPRSESKVKSSSLLSRRSKSFSALRVQTSRSREEAPVSPAIDLCKSLFSDKENMSPDASTSNSENENHDNDDDDDDDDDDDAVSPAVDPCKSLSLDKENMPPDVSKINSEKENRDSDHDDDDDAAAAADDDDDDDDGAFQSDKENCTPRVPGREEGRATANKEIVERRLSRIPFRSLSPGRIPSPRKKWNMVVDTSCFLDEESRKAIQLLEGVRGTRLIVPRMVVRELDCLRRRENLLLFRKTQKASLVLQWIEECMVRTGWWIHVQSSTERLPAAATPPATPTAALPGLAEILSPTADDHILGCAFLFREIKSDGPLVLLTNEVSLKIKAMAEGLPCESPSEFRESLVCPWSKRFLWADSGPRGPTWSTTDAVGPIDVPPSGALRRPAKGAAPPADAAKGLKLILVHNSQYAQHNPSRF